MQRNSDPQEQGRQQVFKGMNVFLQANTYRNKWKCEEIGFQEMDRIDLEVPTQQVHEAVERESCETGEACTLPPVIGNVLINCQFELEIHSYTNEIRDDCVYRPRKQQADQ